MNGGRIVESQPVRELFAAPKETYPKNLLAAVSQLGSTRGQKAEIKTDVPGQRAIAEIRDLTVRFDIHGGLPQRPV